MSWMISSASSPRASTNLFLPTNCPIRCFRGFLTFPLRGISSAKKFITASRGFFQFLYIAFRHPIYKERTFFGGAGFRWLLEIGLKMKANK